MEAMLLHMEEFLEIIVECAVLMFEYIGVAIIILTGIRGLIRYIKRDSGTKLLLMEQFTISLEFMLASEILRTITAASFKQIGVVAGIILLRVALTILLHWEIKHEKEEGEEHKA